MNTELNNGETLETGWSSEGPIVGIDLGTTNSVVAGLVDGKVQIFEENGEAILPSIVGIDSAGKMITGIVARNQLAAFPERTIASVKRKMGSQEKIALGDQQFTPQEISAMILRRLRDRASRVLGVPVERAVITVPAFFDESQRQATREAGLLAGLKVERIINEPTAATLVYHAGTDDEKNVIVYDFGGGTFDVSIVRFESGVVEVLSSKGDTHLGGDDVDQLLLDWVADQFQEEHEIDLRTNPTTRYRLLQSCEAAKRSLSRETSVKIVEEFIAEKDGKPLNLDVEISRNEFEELIESLILKTIASVDEAVRDSGLSLDKIHELVLVGGSTRIPLVVEKLISEFKLIPSRAVDPDLAVALGAATQAAMLAGESVGPVLVDVTGHTLGIEVLMDSDWNPKTMFSPIIYRNSALPATFENVYYKLHPDQKVATIRIFQGESSDLDKNHFIGVVNLDLDPNKDDSRVSVRFALTLDGVLKVTATEVGSGNSKELVVDNALSAFQDEDREVAAARLGAMFDSSDEILDDTDLPKQDWQPEVEKGARIENGHKYPAAVAILEQAMAKLNSLSYEDRKDVDKISNKLINAISKDDATQVASLCEELDDVLFYVEG